MKIILIITAMMSVTPDGEELNFNSHVITHSQQQCEDMRKTIIADLYENFAVVKNVKSSCGVET